MKEPDYVMQIMTTYGTMKQLGDQKLRHVMVNGSRQVHSFRYPEVVHNHYQYRDVIDNHNSQRMHPISMEETWMTTRWPNRVFCFLLAVTMVNVQNAGVYYCNLPKVDSLTARKLIAQQLIENKYLIADRLQRKRPRRGETSHCLISLPTSRKFDNGRMVRCRSKYQTWFCECKAARVRTYCTCSPGILYCPECYAKHQVEASMEEFVHT